VPAVMLRMTHKYTPAGILMTHRHMSAIILRLTFIFTIPHQVCVSWLPCSSGVHVKLV